MKKCYHTQRKIHFHAKGTRGSCIFNVNKDDFIRQNIFNTYQQYEILKREKRIVIEYPLESMYFLTWKIFQSFIDLEKLLMLI